MSKVKNETKETRRELAADFWTRTIEIGQTRGSTQQQQQQQQPQTQQPEKSKQQS